MDTHKGWTIARDAGSGLQFVFRPDGTKYGQTQTEAAAKIMRRRAILHAEIREREHERETAAQFAADPRDDR